MWLHSLSLWIACLATDSCQPIRFAAICAFMRVCMLWLQDGWTILMNFALNHWDRYGELVPTYSLRCLNVALKDARIRSTINMVDPVVSDRLYDFAFVMRVSCLWQHKRTALIWASCMCNNRVATRLITVEGADIFLTDAVTISFFVCLSDLLCVVFFRRAKTQLSTQHRCCLKRWSHCRLLCDAVITQTITRMLICCV